jgi:hypothetical protein
MLKDRCIKTFLISLILIGICGFIKIRSVDARKSSKAAEARFWIMKTHYQYDLDMIIMGDSRAYRGISPESMNSVLKGWKILNFGYSSGGFNPLIYKEAEKRLNPESNKRTILLAITPYSLTPLAEKNEHFLQEKYRKREYIYEKIYFKPMLDFFSPLTPREVLSSMHIMNPENLRQYIQEYHDDGWVASYTLPDNPSWALEAYESEFDKNIVSPEIISALMKQVEEWTEKGIKILAFRVPTTLDMVNLENEKSAFNEKAFTDEFEKAGGVWLNIPIEPYHSYDGSHLHRNSAEKLSKDLARKINANYEDSF